MFTADLSASPFVLTRHSGVLDGSDLDAVRGYLEWEAAQPGPIYCFTDLRGAVLQQPTRVLRSYAALFGEFQDRRRLALLVLIIDNRLIVSAINAIRWISPPPIPEITVRNGRHAVRAAVDRLRELRAPPLPAYVRAQLVEKDDNGHEASP